ncbi:MAG: arylesterase [Gemmatimonadetes bacterium]|nr:arylesterase [Gemmatimonadota bacterium]|tara:strand:+ start:1174 stop:1815 length:642 start_codon:yes stop_codon:yes gene_type:complete
MVNLRVKLLVSLILLLAGVALAKEDRLTVLFVGDSITAGLGIDEDQAFPALLQTRLDSMDWPVTAINAGLSGETSSGGLRRINWLLKQKVDVLVLELGANDGLRGIDLTLTERNLRAIVAATKEKHPYCEIIIAGMQVPTNLGQEYTTTFREMFGKVALDTGSELIPFLLENVGGIPELNLPDGKHPTAEGHKILAENVWKVLEAVLRKRQEE